jgi:hypothetical protein
VVGHRDGELAAERAREQMRAGFGQGPQIFGRAREEPESGELGDGIAGRAHRDERRPERGERHLVDAERSLQWIRAEPRDQSGASDDEARLRAAEQLVAAEGHEIGAAADRFAGGGLVWEPDRFERDEGAAPEVLDERDAVLGGERRELFEARSRGEADDAVVARVGPEDESGPASERAREVADVGSIRRSDLAENGSALGEEIGEAEGSADLDELAARDQHLAA